MLSGLNYREAAHSLQDINRQLMRDSQRHTSKSRVLYASQQTLSQITALRRTEGAKTPLAVSVFRSVRYKNTVSPLSQACVNTDCCSTPFTDCSPRLITAQRPRTSTKTWFPLGLATKRTVCQLATRTAIIAELK